MGANQAGSGNVVLQLHGDEAVFSQLSYTYPLKLLSPRATESKVGIAYVLTYGGGLVGGDQIHLNIDVRSGARLLLLTQGSTKVFKRRVGFRAASTTSPGATTVQTLDATVAAGGLLLLLPDPVTCFLNASYDQKQLFRLNPTASLVLLDWFTSGRMSRGEEWDFSRYRSINEVWVGERRLARDVQLLENDVPARNPSGRLLKDRLGRYSCYATVIVHGPLLRAIMGSIDAHYHGIAVFQQSAPPPLIWSLTQLSSETRVIRVAGRETETVKSWLRDELRGLEEIVGIDVYSKSFI